MALHRVRFWITSMCMREMQKGGGGSVVFIASAFEATAGRLLYECMRAAEVKLVQNFVASMGGTIFGSTSSRWRRSTRWGCRRCVAIR